MLRIQKRAFRLARASLVQADVLDPSRYYKEEKILLHSQVVEERDTS